MARPQRKASHASLAVCVVRNSGTGVAGKVGRASGYSEVEGVLSVDGIIVHRRDDSCQDACCAHTHTHTQPRRVLQRRPFVPGREHEHAVETALSHPSCQRVRLEQRPVRLAASIPSLRSRSLARRRAQRRRSGHAGHDETCLDKTLSCSNHGVDELAILSSPAALPPSLSILFAFFVYLNSF